MIDIDKVRERSDIGRVVSQYVQLRKAGVSLSGKCPFHKEDTPSFYVHPHKGYFKCFGCGAGGDVFTFIQDIEGVSFKQALRILADRAGVEINDKPFTKEQREAYRRELEDRELKEFMRLRDRLAANQVQETWQWRMAYYKNYREWLREELAESKRCCWAVVSLLTMAQRKALSS